MTSGVELLLRHNAWANVVLIDACSRLPEADLVASNDAVYGPVPDTLHHVVGNEAWYLALFGVQIEGAPARGERFGGWDAMRALAVRTGEALAEQGRLLDQERRLHGEMNGRAYDMPGGHPAGAGGPSWERPSLAGCVGAVVARHRAAAARRVVVRRGDRPALGLAGRQSRAS